ncbi:MAG: caspase family protein, partial [Dermatophilaceae bacterium]|nr:caspase family protein [Dermatophilaceae bacterium]
SIALGPEESTSVDLVGQVDDELWRAGTVSLRDQLMVVTSTIEFDPRSLEQEELDVRAVPTAQTGPSRGARTPAAASNLQRALDGTRTRRLGPSGGTAAVADWRTDSVFVVTNRPR